MACIEFHFNAPALIPYACRLVRKVHVRGLRAQVVGHDTTLAQLDQTLWTFSALDFLPHCDAHAHPDMREASSVLLSQAPVPDWSHQVLINLGEGIPQGFEGFERIIDVVTLDDLNRAQARERWRAYTRLGHQLVRHDLNKTQSL